MTDSPPRTLTPAALRRAWWMAFAIFILAGSTGAWMRFGVTSGFPAGLQFTNLRHAHSHLMYFGWVTPALMALILSRLPELTQRAVPAPFGRILGFIFVAALLAYVPFMLFGYRPAQIGGRSLPLSVMAAGVNVVGWYLFAWHYRRYTRGVPRILPLQLWDTAVLFMLLASLGGWGLPLLTLLRVEDPLISMALTHLFLDTFADGWFVLALLGLIYARLPEAARLPLARRSHDLMVMGLPVLFILGIPTHLMTLPLRLIGGAGGLLVGLGLLGHVWALAQNGRFWRLPLFFLGLKAVAQLALIMPAVAVWAERSGLRVSYLHWLLLGFISVGLVTMAGQQWPQQVRGQRGFAIGVVILISTLLPLTRLWPSVWNGRWVLTSAAIGALGPLLAAIAILLLGVSARRRYPLATT